MRARTKIAHALGHRCAPTPRRGFGFARGAVTCWCGQRWVHVLVAGAGYRWYRAESEVRR
jgi:hypothetical protein